MGHYSRRSESQPRAVVLGVARRARRGVAGTRAGPSTTDSRWWLTCTSTSAIEISEHSLLGMCGLVLSTVRRPNCRTSYENVAGQGVTARGSLRKPRPDRIPARARLTAHRKAACWAHRRLDGPTTNLRCQSRGLRSKRTDTADDQSRWCRFPQRLHTPTPDVLAGQRCQCPASAVVWTRTSRRIPGGPSATRSDFMRLCRSQACDPKYWRSPKQRRFDTPTRYKKRASETRFRRSSLKERGRVKAVVTSGLGCLRPRRTRRSRRRCQGSGGARPRSGRRALRSAPISTNNVGGGDSVSGRFLRSRNGLAVRSSGPGSRLGG